MQNLKKKFREIVRLKSETLCLLTETCFTPKISLPKSVKTMMKKAMAIPMAVFPKFSSPQVLTIYGTTTSGATKLKNCPKEYTKTFWN